MKKIDIKKVVDKLYEQQAKGLGSRLRWPKVFLTPDEVTYENSDNGRLEALADAMCGWGNCFSGAPMPEKFGVAMAKISQALNITATAENLHECFNDYKKQGIIK
jgi:hypothetical protein